MPNDNYKLTPHAAQPRRATARICPTPGFGESSGWRSRLDDCRCGGLFSAAHPEGVVPLPNAQIVAECRGLAPLARRHALVSTERRLARPVDIPNWRVEPRLETVKAGDGGGPAGLTTSLHRL